MNKDAIPAHSVKVCRGAASCPHAVLGEDLTARLEAVVEASGWPRFLAAQIKTPRHHHQFRLAVASCPNGCSQPHIADFALIACARVAVDPGRCSACGQCVEACAEKALELTDAIRLDEDRCLGCGACVRVCPEGAITAPKSGYRVLLGGKLGRHPRLAHELGIFPLDQCEDILARVLRLFMERYRPGLRLGELIEETGRGDFDALVRP